MFQRLKNSQKNSQNNILAFGRAKENYDEVGGMRTTLLIARVGSFFSILQNPQDLHYFAPLQTQRLFEFLHFKMGHFRGSYVVVGGH